MTSSVLLLGSTGSIGRQTLDVLSRHRDKFGVFALTANSRWQTLAEQCLTWQPRYAAMADVRAADQLRNHLQAAGSQTQVLVGHEAICQLAAADEADMVVAAIVGAAGVLPSLAAVKAGKRVLLANKEALVVTGSLFMQAVKQHGATLLPLDSEHSAIFQCLACEASRGSVERLILTASGGPFRGFDRATLAQVTVEQALAHPNWQMGPKISIDSATLMNKGLELIEACWLFDVTPEQIEIVVHPQSVVHSMVRYVDGAVMAQMGTPDMRCPIALGLSWPERVASGAESLDFFGLSDLTFEAPDEKTFACLPLARQAMQAGGTTTAVLNAANEEAVAAFLQKKIAFLQISQLVEDALQQVAAPECSNVEDVMQIDRNTRQFVRERLRAVCL